MFSSRPRTIRLVLLGLVVLCLLAVLYVAFGVRQSAHAPASLAEVAALPTDPRSAIFEVAGKELALKNGTGSADDVTASLIGDIVYGDLNDDGTEDAVLLLDVSSPQSARSLYVAAALKEGEGYLGTNAVSLNMQDVPRVDITNTVLRVTDTHTAGDARAGDSARHFIVSGAYVREVDVREDESELMFGIMSRSEDGLRFEACDARTYVVDTNSPAFAALEAIAEQKALQKDSPAAFLAVLGVHATSTGVEAPSIAVHTIVAAPSTHSCPASPKPQERAADTETLEKPVTGSDTPGVDPSDTPLAVPPPPPMSALPQGLTDAESGIE